MSDVRHDKKVTVVLDRPFMTNGKTLSGKVEVDEATAEDLTRRMQAAQQNDRDLHRDKGTSDLNAGTVVGSGN